MPYDEDGWEYHQDGRDSAACMGCFVIVAIIVCGAVVALSALLVG